MSGLPNEPEWQDQLEQLIVELAATGSAVFVFGVGWLTTHLSGSTTPSFSGGGADRRWHVEVGDEGRWVMSVKVSEITSVSFIRGPNPFPKFTGQESLVVNFVGPDRSSTLHCYLTDIYHDMEMDANKLEAWTTLRDRFGMNLANIEDSSHLT